MRSTNTRCVVQRKVPYVRFAFFLLFQFFERVLVGGLEACDFLGVFGDYVMGLNPFSLHLRCNLLQVLDLRIQVLQLLFVSDWKQLTNE